MRFTVGLLAVLGCLAVASAAPSPPAFAKIYNATMTWQNLVSGEYLDFYSTMDLPTQRYLVAYPSEGLTIYQRYDQQKEYVVKFTECTIRPLSGKLQQLAVPSSAAYQGTSTISGKTADVWAWSGERVQSTFYSLANQPADKQVPLREIDKATTGFSIQIDFTTFTPMTSIPASYFDVPAFLKSRCTPATNEAREVSEAEVILRQFISA